MHLILDPAEDAAHGQWLRETTGSYEWWYFDAISDNSEWAVVAIWFLGNPFSPYYRLAAIGLPADPFAYNALFCALSRHGRLHAYHFTTFPRASVFADEIRPATLQFGENTLRSEASGEYRLRLTDENANRRQLKADLFFSGYPVLGREGCSNLPELGRGDISHYWLPAAPACRVTADITLREAQNSGAEVIRFTGSGYHDHNWGKLPFQNETREWYWARVSLGEGRALVVYHLVTRPKPISHLLLFDHGRLILCDNTARISLGRYRMNGFGTVYATRLAVKSNDMEAVFHLEKRLDSAPFYLRTLCRADVLISGQQEIGLGIGEFFRPHSLTSRVTASATKARIVER